MFGRQRVIGRVLLVLAFAAAGVIASPVSPAAADRGEVPGDRVETCYQMSVHRLDGPAVLALPPPADGVPADCTRVARGLLQEILADSAAFPATMFPAAAVLGSLTR